MFGFNFFASKVARSLPGIRKGSVLEDYVRRNEMKGLYEYKILVFCLSSLCFMLFEYVDTIEFHLSCIYTTE